MALGAFQEPVPVFRPDAIADKIFPEVVTRQQERYAVRALADPRPTTLGDARLTVDVGAHRVAAGCDVVLLDNEGYEGRVCVWAIQERALTQDDLGILAYPMVTTLGNELCDDRVVAIEFWFLRADKVERVSAERARAKAADFNTLVYRLTSP
jgi:hypothetical protein